MPSDLERAVGTSIAADGSSARCIYWRPGHRLQILPPLAGTWQNGESNAHYVSNTGLVGGNSNDTSGTEMPVVWLDADQQASKGALAPDNFGGR